CRLGRPRQTGLPLRRRTHLLDPGLRRRAVVRRTRRLAGRRVAETGQGTQRGTFARLRFSTAPLEPDLEADPRRGTIRQFLVSGQAEILRRFHCSFVILDLSFVIASRRAVSAMTNDKSKMTNEQ